LTENMEQDNSWINAIYSIILEGQQIITGTLSYTVMICTTVRVVLQLNPLHEDEALRKEVSIEYKQCWEVTL